ncbi:chemotaxis protein CheB [Thermochromatium tepidum]|uniref:protein-glutamate O-methyltransferase n=1 Tax=Thermochromatium tepidum ATCC 43061 TaxID=316276 RepID=A0A6I6DYT5_THETI|nr:chemotaxis protein CheB [Thermochromatium tepidum]QGU32754.1 PAS domain-containing protein [Thermochromatium tepidum ATCC 43061]
MNENTPSQSDGSGSAKPLPFDGYVVCIGASAGGLDALEKFFKACPTDLGVAFVVVQHLSPDHKSMMSNLLARHTAMPVTMVEDDMPMEANHVYLIPPGAIMHVSKGHLHLTPKSPRGLTLPIDIFFSSLAEVYERRAVGVILSGTGTDGTRGAVAINAAGGFLMAQDPESAKFDGMPRSVIATGLVDAILPAEELPARLLAHIRNIPYQEPKPESPHLVAHPNMTTEEILAALLHLLHQVGGIDFSDYKPTTIKRRIDRRMQVRHTPDLYQYYELLEHDRNEILTLRREMLISVTSFFRDPETFNAVAETVIAPMVTERPPHEPIRVWVAGVATGEEAYSIGMLFIEACEREHRWPSLKIFATDVDQSCIETASIGQYPESAAAELSPERLERFFTRKGDRFVIKNELRQCIIFARHNLLADPPFTKMDLVVCRNTLIYFNTAAQEHALRSLQYALREGGVLWLGSSESLSASTEGLQTISAKHKLFRRVGPMSLPPLERKGAALLTPPTLSKATSPLSRSRYGHGESSIATLGVNALLSLYTPPAIVVNQQHEAIHLFGDVNPYLQAREGAASLEVSRLLLDQLRPVAAALLYKATRDRGSIVSDLIEVRLKNNERRQLRLAAHPLPTDGDERLTLLCFEVAPNQALSTESEPIDVDAETMARIEVLERELAATRESLQATIEELETSNEELQATNEELMASNEELQSSNEELQSVNEEMSTVNAEFQEKMLVLNRLNADLDSMARAAGVATIFLDAELHITRFSPDATQIFKLRESDAGRPLSDISHVLRYPRLLEDLRQTLLTQRPIETEVVTLDDKKTYLVRILPYLIPSTTVNGVVATFVDVTAFHDARRLQSILDALPEHIAVLDHSGCILMVNAAWRRFARASGDKGLTPTGPGVNYLEACRMEMEAEGDYAEQACRGLQGVLEGRLPTFSLEYPSHSADEERWFVMNVIPVMSQDIGVVVSHVNITPWRRSRNA